MICHRANAQKDRAIEADADEPTAIYLRRTPTGVALGCIGVVLVLIFVATSTLLACVVYPFIWLSIKSGLLAQLRGWRARPTGRSLTCRFWTRPERVP
jgi:hypothetical protein